MRLSLLPALLLTGCASLRGADGADGTLLYVAPFVDETPGMQLGMTMTVALQDHLYQQAPRRFLVVFDDAAFAVDGTVLAVSERAASGRKRDVIVSARVLLVDKRGVVRHETGIVERSARYEPGDDATDTAKRRERAVAIATTTVGRALADAILRVP